MKKRKVEWLDRALVLGPYYCLVTTEQMFQEALDHLGIKPADRPDMMKCDRADAAIHHFDRDGKSTSIVAIRGFETRTPLEVCGLLVHEAVHLWQEFALSIGEYTPSREFEAYSIQCIAQRLMESFVEQTT